MLHNIYNKRTHPFYTHIKGYNKRKNKMLSYLNLRILFNHIKSKFSP